MPFSMCGIPVSDGTSDHHRDRSGSKLSWRSQLRKSILSLLLAGASLKIVGTSSAFAYDGGIKPTAGPADGVFEVWGTGLEPGTALDINFVSPAGTVFSTAAVNAVVVVAPDGNYSFSFRPVDVFTGESTGTWTFQSCTSGMNDCDTDTFDIQ